MRCARRVEVAGIGEQKKGRLDRRAAQPRHQRDSGRCRADRPWTGRLARPACSPASGMASALHDDRALAQSALVACRRRLKSFLPSISVAQLPRAALRRSALVSLLAHREDLDAAGRLRGGRHLADASCRVTVAPLRKLSRRVRVIGSARRRRAARARTAGRSRSSVKRARSIRASSCAPRHRRRGVAGTTKMIGCRVYSSAISRPVRSLPARTRSR